MTRVGLVALGLKKALNEVEEPLERLPGSLTTALIAYPALPFAAAR